MAHLLDGRETHGLGRQLESRVKARKTGVKDQRNGRQNEQAEGQSGGQQGKAGACLQPVPHQRNQQKNRDESVDDRRDARHKMQQHHEKSPRPGWRQRVNEKTKRDCRRKG